MAIGSAEGTYIWLVASYGEAILANYHTRCYITWDESTDEYLIYIFY